MDAYKSQGEAKELKGHARTTPPFNHKLRKAAAVITLATVLTGVLVYENFSHKKENATQGEKSHNQISNVAWNAWYYVEVHRAVREHAAKMLNVDVKEVSLSSNMSQAYRAVGLDTKFAAYDAQLIEARAGSRSILYDIGEPIKVLAREKKFTGLKDFLARNLESMGIVARLRPAENDKSKVIVEEWGTGKIQEEAKVNLLNGNIDNLIVLFRGFAFSTLPPELAMKDGAAYILKFDGVRFIKDKSYSELTFGGDRGYYLDDRNAGIYFKPDRTLEKCIDISNPDSCAVAGYDGDLFNQQAHNQQGDVGVRGIRVFLIHEKDGKDKIYPVPEGAIDEYNKRFDKLVVSAGLAGELPKLSTQEK